MPPSWGMLGLNFKPPPGAAVRQPGGRAGMVVGVVFEVLIMITLIFIMVLLIGKGVV